MVQTSSLDLELYPPGRNFLYTVRDVQGATTLFEYAYLGGVSSWRSPGWALKPSRISFFSVPFPVPYPQSAGGLPPLTRVVRDQNLYETKFKEGVAN